MVLIFEQCNPHKPCNCVVFQDLSDEMKSYIDFKKDDFWVYQLQQDTNIYDTLTCTNLGILDIDCRGATFNTNSQSCTKSYELSLRHSNQTYFPHFNMKVDEPGVEKIYAENWGTFEICRLHRDVVFANGSRDCFVFPQIDPQKVNVTAFKSQKIDSISLGKYVFKNTILSTINVTGATYLEVSDSFYFQSNIGLVRYNINIDKIPNQTWQLVKYQLK
jgi:hypothetical protein